MVAFMIIIHRRRNDMPEHIKRLFVEQEELNTKVCALNTFINSNPIYDTLPAEERYDLNRQLGAMGDYLHILTQRLKRAMS
ncbi:hypothetical protein [Aeromonas phage phiA014S]|uniref:Uncharacterized protein n=1 Tax=Aeromonas phage phiA014S TaxID=3119845 RepID=A0ABZ2CQ95_9CAUD